jgi:hypothetical protein
MSDRITSEQYNKLFQTISEETEVYRILLNHNIKHNLYDGRHALFQWHDGNMKMATKNVVDQFNRKNINNSYGTSCGFYIPNKSCYLPSNPRIISCYGFCGKEDCPNVDQYKLFHDAATIKHLRNYSSRVNTLIRESPPSWIKTNSRGQYGGLDFTSIPKCFLVFKSTVIIDMISSFFIGDEN